MDILDEVKKLQDSDILEFVNMRINELENTQLNEKVSQIIGFLLDYNERAISLTDFAGKESFIDLVNKFDGYIPRDTLIVYQALYDVNRSVVSNGCGYYYIDDDSYIVDFCRYIKNKRVDDYYTLFNYVYKFCGQYFGYLECIDRKQMLRHINENETSYFPLYFDNRFSMFKGKGNAQCSEIAVLTQNILAFLGVDVSLILGTICSIDESVAHAYNLVSFKDNLTKEDVSLVLDLARPSYVAELTSDSSSYIPYMGVLPQDKDKICEYLHTNLDEAIVLPDYIFLNTGNNIWQFESDTYRNYTINPMSNKKYTKQ